MCTSEHKSAGILTSPSAAAISSSSSVNGSPAWGFRVMPAPQVGTRDEGAQPVERTRLQIYGLCGSTWRWDRMDNCGSTAEWRSSPGPGGESALRMPDYWRHVARRVVNDRGVGIDEAERMPNRRHGLPRRLPPPAGRWLPTPLHLDQGGKHAAGRNGSHGVRSAGRADQQCRHLRHGRLPRCRPFRSAAAPRCARSRQLLDGPGLLAPHGGSWLRTSRAHDFDGSPGDEQPHGLRNREGGSHRTHPGSLTGVCQTTSR